MKRALLISLPITLISVVLSLIFRIHIAQTVGPETQSYYYTTVDLAGLMAIVFIGFRSSMTVAYQKSKDSDSITLLFRWILLFFTLFSALVLSYPLYLFVDKAVHLWQISLLFIVFGIYIYFTNRLAMFRLYKTINRLSLLETPILIAFFFVLFTLGVDVLESLIFAVILQNISLAIFVKLSNKAVLTEPRSAKIKLGVDEIVYLKNSAISSLEFVFGIGFIYLGIFCAKIFFGIYELSIYQVVIKPIFMYSIMLFVFPIVKFIFPELSLLVNENRIDEIRSIQKWIQKYALTTTIALCFGLFLLGMDGISFIFGKYYKQSFWALAILLPSIYFAIMNAFYISLLKAHGRFIDSLTIRASSILFFGLIFSVFELFGQNFLHVVAAISLSYICINLVSIRLLGKI